MLTSIAMFPLICMGGLVTSHHAGMSVPDWPNSYGYNMFLFPPSHWVGGILYEHTHRLMGTVVGYLSILGALWAWGPAARLSVRRGLQGLAIFAGGVVFAAVISLALLHPASHTRAAAVQGVVSLLGLDLVLIAACFARRPEPRRWVRWLATGLLLLVMLQGALGGLRVVLVKLDLAILHACLAQAVFCVGGLLAVVTSRWWAASRRAGVSPDGRRFVLLCAAAVAVIYLQLIVGATMRHNDAGLAIPDFPLAYGKLLPPTSGDALAAANRLRAFSLNLDPVTMGQVWLHFAHRLGAIAVSLLVLTSAATALRRRQFGGIASLGLLLIVLLTAQLTLGALTVLMRKPADVASLHVAVGALVLLTEFVLAVRAARLFWTPAPPERSDAAFAGRLATLS